MYYFIYSQDYENFYEGFVTEDFDYAYERAKKISKEHLESNIYHEDGYKGVGIDIYNPILISSSFWCFEDFPSKEVVKEMLSKGFKGRIDL